MTQIQKTRLAGRVPVEIFARGAEQTQCSNPPELSKQPLRPASVIEAGALLLAQSPEGVTVWSLWARTGHTSARNVPSGLKRIYGIGLEDEGQGNAGNDGWHKRHWIKNRADCLKVLSVVNSERKKRNAPLLTQAEIDQIAALYPAD